MVRYWFKIVNGNDNSLMNAVYRMLRSCADNNINYGGANWATQIKEILQTHGFSDLWLTQDVKVSRS